MSSPEDSEKRAIIFGELQKNLEGLQAQKENLERMAQSAESNMTFGGYNDSNAEMLADLERQIIAKEREISEFDSKPDSEVLPPPEPSLEQQIDDLKNKIKGLKKTQETLDAVISQSLAHMHAMSGSVIPTPSNHQEIKEAEDKLAKLIEKQKEQDNQTK